MTTKELEKAKEVLGVLLHPYLNLEDLHIDPTVVELQAVFTTALDCMDEVGRYKLTYNKENKTILIEFNGKPFYPKAIVVELRTEIGRLRADVKLLELYLDNTRKDLKHCETARCDGYDSLQAEVKALKEENAGLKRALEIESQEPIERSQEANHYNWLDEQNTNLLQELAKVKDENATLKARLDSCSCGQRELNRQMGYSNQHPQKMEGQEI